MKKLLFISSLDATGEKLNYDGVMKKLLYQIKTLEEMGFDVDYVKRKDNVIYICNNNTHKSEHLIDTVPSFYDTMKRLYLSLTNRIPDMQYDVVYMRYEHLSWPESRFFKKVKNHNKQIRLYAELPTYMGKWEPGASLLAKVKFIINRISQIIIPLNVDRVVTFSDHERIYGIKTIRIENFADIESLPVRQLQEEDGFHMMGVAMMTPSHGYDRVIKGLKEYYDSNPAKKVYLHLIGKGYVVPEWKRLVEEYNLSKYVIFEGIKSGKDLDDYFNRCQVAVATLAIFRKKCPKASELKIREYTARGIPFIYSAYEPQFEDQSFCLKEPHDESPINIQQVLDFYYGLDTSIISKKMREFAMNNCTCKKQFEKVFLTKNNDSCL